MIGFPPPPKFRDMVKTPAPFLSLGVMTRSNRFFGDQSIRDSVVDASASLMPLCHHTRPRHMEQQVRDPDQ